MILSSRQPVTLIGGAPVGPNRFGSLILQTIPQRALRATEKTMGRNCPTS